MKALSSELSNDQHSVRPTMYPKGARNRVDLCRTNLKRGLCVHCKVAQVEQRYTIEAAVTDSLPSVCYVSNPATLWIAKTSS